MLVKSVDNGNISNLQHVFVIWTCKIVATAKLHVIQLLLLQQLRLKLITTTTTTTAKYYNYSHVLQQQHMTTTTRKKYDYLHLNGVTG